MTDDSQKSREELIAELNRLRYSEKSLRTATAFLDTILENIPDMIFVKEADELRFVRFNRAGEKLLGYSSDFMRNKNDYDFFPKDEADHFTAKDREVLSAGDVVEISEEPIHTKNGERLLHTKKVPILSEDGKPLYLLGISEDITEKKKTQEKLTLLTLAMENMLEAFAEMDAGGRIIHANGAYTELFGYADEGLKGVLFESLVHQSNHSLMRQAYHDVVSKGKVEISVSAKRKDGKRFDLLAVFVRASIEAAKAGTFFCFAQDVSERKYKEALEIKTDLVSMISHELRTPLHTIREGLKLIRDGLVGETTDEQKEVLGSSSRSVERLIRMVNAVLDLQKLEAGVVEFLSEEVLISELIDGIVAELTPLAAARKILLQREIDTALKPVFCDKDRISQVLFNLIHNAIKFSTEGKIVISANLSDDRSEAVISVKDHGPGIKEEDMPKIFRNFGQLEGTKKSGLSGTGLGLAISKKIITQHHGRIWVESRAGEGSAFIFTLPCQ